MQKYEGQPFHYTVAKPFLKLRVYDKSSFFASGIDNFDPLFVKIYFS